MVGNSSFIRGSIIVGIAILLQACLQITVVATIATEDNNHHQYRPHNKSSKHNGQERRRRAASNNDDCAWHADMITRDGCTNDDNCKFYIIDAPCICIHVAVHYTAVCISVYYYDISLCVIIVMLFSWLMQCVCHCFIVHSCCNVYKISHRTSSFVSSPPVRINLFTVSAPHNNLQTITPLSTININN